MISQGHLRTRRARLWLTTAVMLAAVGLSGCYVEGPYSVAKHLRPISSEMISLMERKGMAKTSPLLLRIFKEEAELEVWKQDASGQFALLKTYPICRWSGQLGPKTREGDRQAPEGFYAITPGAMNPNSSFYLSFNLGYPNAFDRAHGRTGAHLMVHGDCSSRGCYSMTDDQIAEIFALGREAFFAGQKSFQVQAFPFRMTALNMAKHRNSPHMSFWRNLKEGYDHFEVTKQEPKVDVCEKRYVFNAGSPPGSTAPLAFQAAGKCPAYQVDPEISSAVAERSRRYETDFAGYLRRNIATVPTNTGRDGGMHPYFQAKYESREVRDGRGRITGVVVEARAPTMSSVDAYPREPAMREPSVQTAAVTPSTPTAGVAADVPMPRAVPGRSRAVASSGSRSSSVSAYSASNGGSSSGVGSFFSNIYTSGVSSVTRALGINSQETKPTAASEMTPRSRRAARPNPPASAPPTPPQRPAQEAAKTQTAGAQAQPANGSATGQPAPARPSSAAGLVSGAQPVVPAGTFEQRWQGSFR